MRELVIKPLVAGLLTGVTFIDTLDIGLRVVSAVSAILVSWYAIQSYKARRDLDKEQLKKLKDNEDK